MDLDRVVTVSAVKRAEKLGKAIVDFNVVVGIVESIDHHVGSGLVC